MSWKRTAMFSLLFLPMALAVAPVLAAAADATLYEVTENMKLKGGKVVHRVATAALMGAVDAGNSLCPGWLAVAKCAITATASNNVSLATGKGPVEGTFAVVVQDNNQTDGPEFVILRGRLSGNIDLSQAILFAATNGEYGAPIGFLDGQWSAKGEKGGPLKGVKAHGTLTGTFRLPFEYPPYGAVYWGGAGLVPVQAEELSLGVPTVRLEVSFAE